MSWKLQAATCREWLRAYFTNRNVWLDTRKLSELTQIGKEPELARCVNCLTIHCKDESTLVDILEHDEALEYPVQSTTFLQCAPVVALALRNLTNLKRLCFAGSEMDESDRSDMNASAAFATVLSAIKACNLRPQGVYLYSLHPYRGMYFKPWTVMQSFGAALTKLTHLQTRSMLDDLDEFLGDIVTASSRLSFTFNQMRSLRSLELSFEAPSNSNFFEFLDCSLYSPSLHDFILDSSYCTLSDMAKFLSRHLRTLIF